MSERQDRPVIVIGPESRDGTVRLEGRDWFYDYRQERGGPAPAEMGLRIEWLVAKHAHARMERAVSARQAEYRARRQESRDELVEELLRYVQEQEEMGFNAG